MTTTVLGIVAIFGMFAVTLGLLVFGRKLGERAAASDPNDSPAASVAVEGAVFGLMGLLIAFTFSGAASRLDTRRAQLIQEANCIGTVWLRLDLLPPDAQPALREKLREYTDTRIKVFQNVADREAANTVLNRADALQKEIWRLAVAAGSEGSAGQRLLLPALNEMFDMATMRTLTAQIHPPPIIYGMLAILVLAGATLTGYDMGVGKSRRWFHALAFVLVISLAIYVILDFEFPRIGLIRITDMDKVFLDLRQNMNP